MLKTLDIVYFRWSFAWAPVLLDRTGGRLQIALHRQATVTSVEAESILVEHDRLDGWLNYAYRALKSDRDGRALEARLDAAESVPWLLDVISPLQDAFVRTTSTSHGNSANTHCPTGTPRTC